MTPSEKLGVGVLISLFASLIDAIGINLQRRDHVRNAQLPVEQQRHECRRLTWHIGFYMYVGSQLFGSSLALYFLQPAVVAPLGAASLVFNCFCAYFLVGTRISRRDILSTVLIIAGAILVAFFGDIPKDEEMKLSDLLALYSRPVFVIYFSILTAVSLLMMAIAWSLRRQSLGLRNPLFSFIHRVRSWIPYFRTLSAGASTASIKSINSHIKKNRYRKYTGIAFGVAGGTIASMTVLLAETGIRLLLSPTNQFTTFAPFLILIILILSAFMQVYCMNAGLKSCDAVLVVPIFFTFYSVLALINANIYHDQWSKYTGLDYGMMVVGIVLIVPGVYVLSASQDKRPGDDVVEESVGADGENFGDDDDMEGPTPDSTSVTSVLEGGTPDKTSMLERMTPEKSSVLEVMTPEKSSMLEVMTQDKTSVLKEETAIEMDDNAKEEQVMVQKGDDDNRSADTMV